VSSRGPGRGLACSPSALPCAITRPRCPCRLKAAKEALGADNFALTTEVDRHRANLRDINDFLTSELKTKTAKVASLELQLASTRQELEGAARKTQVGGQGGQYTPLYVKHWCRPILHPCTSRPPVKWVLA
jgi:hypothetical protein